MRSIGQWWFVLAACAAALADAPVGAAEAEPKYAVTRDVVYVQRGEEKLAADLYVPQGTGPFPGVLMVHGGAWVSGSKTHMTRHANVAAGAGYAVMAINYRLAPQHKFPAQLEDCQSALGWFRQHASDYKLDSRRVAGYGYSAGGQLVALLGLMDPPAPPAAGDSLPPTNSTEQRRLQAIVAGGAPCDFRFIPANSEMLAFWLGGTRRDKPDIYRQASPAEFVSADDPPVFFFQGTQDRLVPSAGTRLMIQQLRRAGVHVESYDVPDAGHIAAFLDANAPVQAVKFLDGVLK